MLCAKGGQRRNFFGKVRADAPNQFRQGDFAGSGLTINCEVKFGRNQPAVS